MKRDEKITLLEQLMQGRNITGLLPSREVTLIEVERGFLTDFDAKKVIPLTSEKEYLEMMRAESREHTLKLIIIYHEEYATICRDLENEI